MGHVRIRNAYLSIQFQSTACKIPDRFGVSSGSYMRNITSMRSDIYVAFHIMHNCTKSGLC